MALVIEKLHRTMYTHFLHFLFDFIQYMCVPHTSPPCRLTTCKQTIQPYYYIKQRSNLFTVICPDKFFSRAKSHSFMNCLENRSHLRILNCRICKFNLHKHAYMRNTHKKTGRLRIYIRIILICEKFLGTLVPDCPISKNIYRFHSFLI